jgi:hypothetical protein
MAVQFIVHADSREHIGDATWAASVELDRIKGCRERLKCEAIAVTVQ